jgi:hypothetical protein
MTLNQQVFIEIIRAQLTLVLLSVTWFLGQRIIAHWDIVKKRQEFDIAISNEFYRLYGEFKELTKLWRVFYRKTNADRIPKLRRYKSKYEALSFPEDVQWELLRRATAAESELEAVLVKLATERSLCDSDRNNLGNFRQGYEQLRHSIRDNAEPTFGDFDDPRYRLFDALACEVAYMIYMISEDNRRRWKLAPKPEPKQAKLNLQTIKQGGHKAWEEAVSDFVKPEEEARRKPGESERPG